MIREGWAEGRVLGHEFAGITDDGTAVTVEPNLGCGHCPHCRDGYRSHCDEGPQFIGVSLDGGMAEYARVPEAALFPLPTGIDLSIASLMEPLAVAAHGLNRARVSESDRVLVVGAGPIGLASAAVLCGRGIRFDVTARYEHQKLAAEKLGGGLDISGEYDVVVDAVGSTDRHQRIHRPLQTHGPDRIRRHAVESRHPRPVLLCPRGGVDCRVHLPGRSL